MEENHFKVGLFSYTQQGNNQTACYDIKRYLGNNIGVGLFDGHKGALVAKLLKSDFFDSVAFWLEEKNDIKESLYKGLICCEHDSRDIQCGDPMESQASRLVASWMNVTSGQGSLLSLGDSFTCLIGGKAVSMLSPQKKVDVLNTPFLVVGDKTLKNQSEHIYSLELEYYSYPIEDKYDYLVLATHGFYDVLAHEDEEKQYLDFKKIFFDVLHLSKEEFDLLYPSPHDIIKAEESSDDAQGMQNRFGLEDVALNNEMSVLAEKLVQVALSRGSDKNITVIVQFLK